MKRKGVKLENINFNYLRSAIEKENYSMREVSEAIGMSEGHIAKCTREGYIFKEDLDKIRELVPLEDGRLMTVPKGDKTEEVEEKPKMISFDEAIAQIKDVPTEEENEDLMAEIKEIKEIVLRIELAMVRGGFMRKSYDEIARDTLRKMLDIGRCTKADFVSELAKRSIPPTHADKAIKDLGVIEAISRDGRESTTWPIRE